MLFGSDALLGLLTNAVQTLAGVLLPSATVFLLLLCNDKAVLGPWVNGRWLNLFTGAVIWVLVMLSIILTAATVFPDISGATIVASPRPGHRARGGGFRRRHAAAPPPRRAPAAGAHPDRPVAAADRCRQPGGCRRSTPGAGGSEPGKRIWMIVLRAYLVAAVALVAVKVVQLALGQ